MVALPSHTPDTSHDLRHPVSCFSAAEETTKETWTSDKPSEISGLEENSCPSIEFGREANRIECGDVERNSLEVVCNTKSLRLVLKDGYSKHHGISRDTSANSTEEVTCAKPHDVICSDTKSDDEMKDYTIHPQEMQKTLHSLGQHSHTIQSNGIIAALIPDTVKRPVRRGGTFDTLYLLSSPLMLLLLLALFTPVGAAPLAESHLSISPGAPPWQDFANESIVLVPSVISFLCLAGRMMEGYRRGRSILPLLIVFTCMMPMSLCVLGDASLSSIDIVSYAVLECVLVLGLAFFFFRTILGRGCSNCHGRGCSECGGGGSSGGDP